MLIRGRHHSDDEQWAPVSDLMAVVMLIFMLIAMILFINFDRERKESAEQIKEIRADIRNTVLDEEKKKNAERCAETRAILDSGFRAPFRDNFREWGAVLEEDLTIRFTNQRVLFERGSADITQKKWFATAIRDFFPRYMSVITQIRKKFGASEVLAIRIEGHTSSKWEDPNKDPYIANLDLSQRRARNIVEYVLDEKNVPEAAQYQNIVHELVTANGLSSSQCICKVNGEEDKSFSRRVEFKLLTKSCQRAGAYDKVSRPETSCRPCIPKNDADES